MKSGMCLIMLCVNCAVSCSLCLVFSFWVLFSLIIYCSFPLKNYLWRSLRPRMKMPSSQGVWHLLLPGTSTRDTTSSWPLHTQFATWGVLDLPGDEPLFLLSTVGPAIVTVFVFPPNFSSWFAWWRVGVTFSLPLPWT